MQPSGPRPTEKMPAVPYGQAGPAKNYSSLTVMQVPGTSIFNTFRVMKPETRMEIRSSEITGSNIHYACSKSMCLKTKESEVTSISRRGSAIAAFIFLSVKVSF